MRKLELGNPLHPPAVDGDAAPPDVWIDIDVADDEGRRWLVDQSGLDDAVTERLLEPAFATHWRRFGHGTFLGMSAEVPGELASTLRSVEFGIWLERGRIITVRHGEVPALDRAAAACAGGEGPAGSWGLIVMLLSTSLTGAERNLHELTTAIDQLEDEILAGVGGPPIDRIADLQNRLIHARRFRLPLANMLGFISAQPGRIIDADILDELEGIASAAKQHQQLLTLSIDRASALQGHIRDHLADSMNNATYRFTWVATVFLPLSFITGLLGINVAGIPGDHNPLAFWLVCGALCVIAATWGIAVGRMTGTRSRLRRRRSR